MTEPNASSSGTKMNETKDGALKTALVKRSSIKGQITKFRNFLDKFSKINCPSAVEIIELKLKLNKIESLSAKFDELQSEIEVLNQSTLDTEIEIRESIEQDIIINIATAKSLIDHQHEVQLIQKRLSMVGGQCSSDHSEANVKLPRIQISKFDGSYFRWLEFRDTFKNLIYDNDNISDIQKYHYLNSYLEGDAARVVSNFEITAANFVKAWSMLNERYNNKRQLRDNHLDSLCNIQTMTRESAKGLRFLIDHINKNLRALSTLGMPTDQWDGLLVFMLSKRLDPRTLLKWEEARNAIHEDSEVTLETFNKFLCERANVIESMSRNNYYNSNSRDQPPSRSKFNQNPQGKVNRNDFTTALVSTSPHNNKSYRKCLICQGHHRIFDCPTFRAKNINEKYDDVTKHELCSNCLNPGHKVHDCRYMGSCRECNERHNSLLHQSESNAHPAIGNETETVGHAHPAATPDNETETVVTSVSIQNQNQVLLSTAQIKITNPITKQTKVVRALLDCGSQSSFISKSLKEGLSLSGNPIDTVKIVGIGNSSTNQVQESCSALLSSMNDSYRVTFSCYVLKELTGELPKAPIDISKLCLRNDIKMADPNFAQPAPIDVLIGADLFWDIISGEQLSLGETGPKLHNSRLGWLLAGPIPYGTNMKITNKNNNIHCNHALITNSSDESIVHEYLPKFWEMEELPKKTILSESDKKCEIHFLQNTVRASTGRFCVKLPLAESADCLGDSARVARKRLINLEKRFKRNPNLKEQYANFIQEYSNLGHLSISDNPHPKPSYYLCHHAVFKQDSESTRTRVVFDGSNPTSSGYSLNDILMVGPTIQDNLFSILLRARQYKYLLCGDIEKMYRQIEVHPDDRNLQLILWRDDESCPITTLRLNTLTYGTASASYLSTRCLWQVGEECQDEEIKRIIQRDFYVDDLITGADTEGQLKNIKQTVSTVLDSACFKLRKFKSNLPSVLEYSESDNNQDDLTISESSSTLGLGWNPLSDSLHFQNKEIPENTKITKRFIMSNSFKIFDPLGLISPIIIQAKMLLQRLWSENIDWDTPVPQEHKETWLQFSNSLPCLSNYQIPRHVICDSPKYIDIHSFSDASQRAYGACVYIRSVSDNDSITVRLLCAKSKVASLKPVTIPRLELCAALLSARLCNTVVDAIKCTPMRVHYWCDSSVVLGWIKTDPSKLKTFVANRICEINELTESSSWRYIPTDLNPADLVSRGVDACQLVGLDLWWSGPNFLKQDSSHWPILPSNCKGNTMLLPETKGTVLNNSSLTTKELLRKNQPLLTSKYGPISNSSETSSAFVVNPEINEYTNIIEFERFSKLNRLVRIIAYVKRFIYNLKNTKARQVGTFTVDELNDSFTYLCSKSQQQSFPVEYNQLSRGLSIKSKSKLLSLSPFFKNNLIRVGGRIGASEYSFDKRHPILLDSANHLTKLLFEREHINSLHAGPQLLLATIREFVWPINGRRLARRTVHNCVRCIRVAGKTVCPKMGNIPAQRLTPDFPFTYVGLDFAGPFFILSRRGRGAKIVKCYLCLFVCLKYKCIHLEAVSDLSKDSFLMTLRRFVARRGKPIEIQSDNGRNFVAAAKELAQFLKTSTESITQVAAQEGVRFKFIPAYAPHFGGVWEAGVKSAKFHIKRVMGNSHLTFEEITTLFAQVEAVLNSRPLCPLSSSPTDFLFLSPGHFLVGRPLTALPSPALEERKIESLARYARIEKIHQHFWNRWQKEYITELQQRQKWKTSPASRTLTIGDLVLLQEDHIPPLSWRLGRIHRLFPGPDDITRVADVMTIRGCVRRAVVRLCPLHPSTE